MMTLHTFKGFVDGARDAYLKAVKKHPVFTDKVTNFDLDGVRGLLNIAREANDKTKPDLFGILYEEIYEYAEATLLGDREASKRELLDCAAVLMREWERISQ